MPKESEKYQYFRVGFLKDSFALETLMADAIKHHMAEQPAQLIALRLTEYYDLLDRMVPTFPQAVLSTARGSNMETNSRTNSLLESAWHVAEDAENGIATGSSYEPESEIITASPDAQRNADEAADYWATL